jgi:hypothetical protein
MKEPESEYNRIFALFQKSGAGEGNRTLVTGVVEWSGMNRPVLLDFGKALQ